MTAAKSACRASRLSIPVSKRKRKRAVERGGGTTAEDAGDATETATVDAEAVPGVAGDGADETETGGGLTQIAVEAIHIQAEHMGEAKVIRRSRRRRTHHLTTRNRQSRGTTRRSKTNSAKRSVSQMLRGAPTLMSWTTNSET